VRRAAGTRIFLLLGASVLAAYAIAFLLSPALLGSLVGLACEDANAFVEIRAFYGGLELGSAGFLACAAGAARAWGVAEFGFTGPSQPLVAGIELAGAAVALLLARRSP
jgi:hypothetical protein